MIILCALSISANKLLDNATMVQSKAAACVVVSEAEAVGRGLELAREAYPEEEGWFNHAAVSCAVPSDLILMVSPVR